MEGVRNNTYTICRLGPWVTTLDFESTPAKSKNILRDRQSTTGTGDDQWWRKAALDFNGRCPKPRCNGENTSSYRVRLALKPPQDEAPLPVSEECRSGLGAVKSALEAAIDQKAAITITDATPAPFTDPEDIHDMIRASYLEDLYIKKVSIKNCH